MAKSMDTLVRENARLIILKALHGEADESLNSDILGQHLRTFGITKTRDWVHGEMEWLRDIGAVTVTEVGSIKVATLTEKGVSHLTRALDIEGVQRPSRPEA